MATTHSTDVKSWKKSQWILIERSLNQTRFQNATHWITWFFHLQFGKLNNTITADLVKLRESQFHRQLHQLMITLLLTCCHSNKRILVLIPSSVKTIPNNIFEGCPNLKEVTINPYRTKFDPKVFTGCSLINHLIFESTVNSIKPFDFTRFGKLTKITIPSTVNSIGSNSFKGLKTLKEVTIALSVTSIEEGSFYGCSSLERINIPDKVTSIGKKCFLWLFFT